jgi:hypothetical protein
LHALVRPDALVQADDRPPALLAFALSALVLADAHRPALLPSALVRAHARPPALLACALSALVRAKAAPSARPLSRLRVWSSVKRGYSSLLLLLLFELLCELFSFPLELLEQFLLFDMVLAR